MSVDVRCELCNGKMATVSYSKVREYVQKNGEVCKKCANKINDIDIFFEKKRERFMQAFDRLLGKAKDEFSEEVKRLASNEKALR
jgi:protein-arginine kinase activator protein McsA